MTEAEQRDWCAMLGKTPQQQMSVILDMLRHAPTDGMSGPDRLICLRQLQRLADAQSVDLGGYRSNFRRRNKPQPSSSLALELEAS